jgi:carboxymethylenebutenolidase
MAVKEHVKLPNRCEGFLFKPEGKALLGCLIVFHERYGLVQHTLDVANRLAENGYLVLAPDLFSLWDGDKAALHRGDVRAVVSDADSVAQIDHWIAYVKAHAPAAVADKIALFGVCQSGRYPIVVASKRKDISACVIFYGATSERDWGTGSNQPAAMPDMVKNLTSPMFFVLAEEDHTMSIDQMLRMRGALEAADVAYRMRIFADMPHGFINDTMPGRYREAESEKAWETLLAFLDDVFVKGWPNGRVVWDFVSSKSRDYDFSKNRRLE